MHPILRSIRRNKTGPVLVTLQIALCLAVGVSAVYVLTQRLAVVNRPTGVDVPNIFWLTVQSTRDGVVSPDVIAAELQKLRTFPGVVAATTISSPPLSGGGSDLLYGLTPGTDTKTHDSVVYAVDEQGLAALGVALIAGRNFTAALIPRAKPFVEAFNAAPPEIIVTQAFAHQLFGDAPALGQTIYGKQDRPYRIIGVIDRMQGPWPSNPINEMVTLHAGTVTEDGSTTVYLVRTQSGRRDETIRRAQEELTSATEGRFVDRIEALDQTAASTNVEDRLVAATLAVVTVAVLAVTGLGIFGLATFNAITRTKQIGIRRAVGARRFDILRQFLLENWLITSTGVTLGCVLSLALGSKLAVMIHAPRLPLYYLVGGVCTLWTLGLIATLVPARRAAGVSPAIATRTV